MSGRPLIPIALPETGEPEAAAARRVILSGWLTLGPETETFEKEFAAVVDAPHACAASSGTTALHLALLAAGVGSGDEVVTASHSFIATANAVRYCGATPVFADIDPATFNLDPASVEAAITARTRAILCVHQLGLPCDLTAIVALARRRGLPVIEDACCGIGSEILWNGQWEKIGRPQGDAACFSFHPRKVLTTGDGGMLTTRHESWHRRFQQLRQHGMSRPAHQRHTSSEVIFENYNELGYNYRLTDVQAAIGREQLKRLPEIVQRRRLLAARYAEKLAPLGCVTVPAEPSWARSNWQSYGVRLADGLEQRDVMQRLLARGVATRRGVMCAHREPAFTPGTWRAGPGGLRESERAQDRTILLPLFPRLSENDQDYVIEALRDVCSQK
jgi:dTDP-4-amino-4,6-dideoxygalactose transaminase